MSKEIIEQKKENLIALKRGLGIHVSKEEQDAISEKNLLLNSYFYCLEEIFLNEDKLLEETELEKENIG